MSDFNLALHLQNEFDLENSKSSLIQMEDKNPEDLDLAIRLQAEYDAEINDDNGDECFIVSDNLKLNNSCSSSSLQEKIMTFHSKESDSDLALALQLESQWNSEPSTEKSGSKKPKPKLIFDPDNSDFELASQLQNEWNSGNAESCNKINPPNVHTSIVDASWELVDPCPDLHALFVEFNATYFWGRLEGIEVRWSPRMTLCAGLCVYEGRGGLCSVRLSHPLLKLRPRKDLVETLLHEMIHAYLFVTQNNKDHDGHGPEFHKHMYRINNLTGTKISVYHSFHEEVALYKKHWWRCDGPCKDRKPFFGWVKRAMNRAPSARDPWWAQHQQTCGGRFLKVKSPEEPLQKRKSTDSTKNNSKAKEARNQPDIRSILTQDKSLQTAGHKKTQDMYSTKNFTSTPLIKGNTERKQFPSKNLSNVHTINSPSSIAATATSAIGYTRPVNSPDKKKGIQSQDIRTMFSP